MKKFVSFGTNSQQMYFLPTILIKDKIDVVRVPPFQPFNICNTTDPSHKNIDEVRVPQFHLFYICNTADPSLQNLGKLCSEVYYMRWGNQGLE